MIKYLGLKYELNYPKIWPESPKIFLFVLIHMGHELYDWWYFRSADQEKRSNFLFIYFSPSWVSLWRHHIFDLNSKRLFPRLSLGGQSVTIILNLVHDWVSLHNLYEKYNLKEKENQTLKCISWTIFYHFAIEYSLSGIWK